MTTWKTQGAARLRDVIGDESQASFARRSGVAESVLRKYLAGAQPSADRLVRMADAAGIRIAWLAAGRGPMKGSDERAIAALPVQVIDDARRLVKTIEALGAGQQTLPASYPDEMAGG